MTLYSYSSFMAKVLERSKYSPYVTNGVVPGCNGLYGEPELPIRNLCHWSMVEADAGGGQYKCRDELIAELSSMSSFPPKFRQSSKDSCNGLIGMAWLLEAVSYCLSKEEIISTITFPALERYLRSLNFDRSKGVWRAVLDSNGCLRGMDRTFNHQLWFGVCLSRFSKKAGFDLGVEQSEAFIGSVRRNLHIQRGGLIYHTLNIYPDFHKTFAKRILKKNYRKEMNKKEFGYQYFNLLQLGSALPDMPNGVDMFGRKNFMSEIEENEYASTYNPVGLEVAAYRSGFNVEGALAGLNYHFNRFFDSESFMFGGGSDEVTLNARVYELCYLESSFKERLMYSAHDNIWLVS